MALRRMAAATVVGIGLTATTAVTAQENQSLSLKEVPLGIPRATIIPVPDGKPATADVIPGPETDLDFKELVAAGIVKDNDALIRLGKAFFWDMQAGSDAVQACGTCHFSAGADIRSKNQISPGLQNQDFHGPFICCDNNFGNSAVPYTANDPRSPSPGEPPDPKLNVPGFPQFKPNYQLTAKDFPLNSWFRPTELTPRGPGIDFLDEFANVSRDTNDVISSQGVRHTLFEGVKTGDPVDQGIPQPDIFNLTAPGKVSGEKLVRRAEARNAPTVINAVFNFDNFWDGRASFIFNGVDPFGFRDRLSTLKQNVAGKLKDVFVRITNSSLASQAVGPATSNFEMSFERRTFPDVGKKMVSLKPLAKQFVHPQDSVLGSLSLARSEAGGKLGGNKGLNVPTYADMIKAAFNEQWWDNTDYPIAPTQVMTQAASPNNPRTMARSLGKGEVAERQAALGPNQYSQMQWNFSFFWGLAIQAYEATLVSDDTPFDRFEGAPSKGIKGDPTALKPSERNGLTIFMDEDPNIGARCNNCHSAPVMSNHSAVDIMQADLNAPKSQGRPVDILEFMVMGDGTMANYDKGFYNIGVRRTSEDLGRALTAPKTTPDDPEPAFENPDDGHNPFPLSYVALAHLAKERKLPPDVQRFIQLDPVTKEPVPILDRQAIHGNFKAPILRNIRLTGPYFHNGDSATLRQVVEFYTRGGNFPNTNFRDLDVDIFGIPGLRFPEFQPSAQKNIHDLVEFLEHGLTDERVALEKGPFDHPEIIVPNGAPDGLPGEDAVLEIPAVGKNGRPASISTFLNLDPQDPINTVSVGASHDSGGEHH